MGDDPLDVVDGAAVADGRLQHRDLLAVESAVAEQLVEHPRRGGGELLPGERHEHRALALAEIVAGRLARHRGVAEDAEQVVAELERDPQREPEVAEGRDLRERAAGERGPDRERRLDAVFRRLVDDHPVGPRQMLVLGQGAPGHLLEDVEILARRHLGAHPAELGAGGATGRRVPGERDAGIHELVAPAEEQIAEQKGGGEPVGVGGTLPAAFAVQDRERAMHARLAAPQIGVVHDVVVHECGGMERLEPRRDRHDGLEIGLDRARRRDVGQRVELGRVRRDRPPSPVAEEGAEALAAGQQPSRAVVDDIQIGGDGAQLGPAFAEEAVEPGLHEIH